METYAAHDLDNKRADVRTYVPRTVVMILLLDRVINEEVIAPAG